MRFPDSVIISMNCCVCGKEHTVEVSEHAYYQWQSGACIQTVMSTLSATEREQLISHICPACQASIFGADDEEEEEEDEDVNACMYDSLAFTGQWW